MADDEGLGCLEGGRDHGKAGSAGVEVPPPYGEFWQK